MSDDINIFDLPMPSEQKPKPKEPAIPALKEQPAPVDQVDHLNSLVGSTKKSIMAEFMQRAKYGHQGALPMVCKGVNCPFLNICPIYEAKEALPIGKRCPVEKALVQVWVDKLVQSLQIDKDAPEYAVDMDMVYELASLELIRHRATSHMADEPALYKEKIVGYSPQGQPIFDDKLNPALIVLEKLGKRVERLREQLLATRRSQAQLGKLASDHSVRSANILDKARKIAEERRQNNSKVVEAEFKVKPNEDKPE